MRYFGYGSNLDATDLARWCGERGHAAARIEARGVGWLPDAEPVFHYLSRARQGGALSVRERIGSAVPGVLFDVDEAGWRALDAKEGAKYERVRRHVLSDEGDEVEAWTYVVRPEHREPRHVAPTERYVGHVVRGLRAHGLPTTQVLEAAESLEPASLPSALFAYGTLLSGEERAGLLSRHAKERRAATTAGALVDLGAYPGMVRSPGRPYGEEVQGGEVQGEVVELRAPEQALLELDDYEDFQGYGAPESLYRRIVVRARTQDRVVHAWAYLFVGHRRGRALIEGGRWRGPSGEG